ncbi:hypothetical protein B0O80DRAFT_299564 [Mortierella sp. GBAus27b]|nr:hypothetical protein BGX31_006989 [Mortierella sp. GBA43]KAI8356811.1 hypothetical protein B0O80DRAFT_299564 [Mortierella sp. GBAus27b]
MVLLSREPKIRNLVIHVDTEDTLRTKGLPLIYGHPDTFTPLQATVSFETSHDCKAKAVEILFKAAVKTHFFARDEVSRKLEGEQVFYTKHWELETEKPKPGWISKGKYVMQCPVLLDPMLPSSSECSTGRMVYSFEARLKGAKMGFARTDLVVTQEVWVLNSSLPPPSVTTFDNPVTVREEWKSSLGYSITVPSDTLHFGQIVPIAIQLEAFNPGCVHEGEEALITSASFVLQEEKTFRAAFDRNIYETSEKLMNIAVNSGWPQSVDGWQRTIHVSLPSSTTMTADMQTKYLDVTHALVVVIEFRTATMGKSEKLKAQVDVKITAPRVVSAAPPQYDGDVVPGESMFQLGPPPTTDEELPTYSRYE